MSEMMKKVAKVIFDELCPGVRYSPNDQREYYIVARAAIEAMRNPSEEMCKAGTEQLPHDDSVSSIYSTMIDAALKD